MKSCTVVVAAACLALSGCMGYTLKPERPAAMPKASAPPLPLRVGLVVEESQGRGVGFGSRFSEALRQSSLFQDVKYPLPLSRDALSGVDLVINGRFSSSFVQDPIQPLKIMVVVFTGFITGAAMSETSHHLAQAELAVAGPEGTEPKAYDEKVDVVATSMVSMFAEQKTMALGPPAALDNLVARLVQRLIDDRPFFERLGAPAKRAPRRQVAQAAQSEPAGTVQAEPEPRSQAAVEPEPAPKAPEPAPKRRGPLTSAEEKAIDEQLMP